MDKRTHICKTLTKRIFGLTISLQFYFYQFSNILVNFYIQIDKQSHTVEFRSECACQIWLCFQQSSDSQNYIYEGYLLKSEF